MAGSLYFPNYLHDLPTGRRLAAYPAADVLCDSYDPGCGTQNLAFAPDGRTLATGHLDGTVLLWKVPAVGDDDSREIAESDRERLWEELGSDTPAKAQAAVERLVRRPAAALPLLRSRFQPAPTPADPVLAALVKDLDSEVFATRANHRGSIEKSSANCRPAFAWRPGRRSLA